MGPFLLKTGKRKLREAKSLVQGDHGIKGLWAWTQESQGDGNPHGHEEELSTPVLTKPRKVTEESSVMPTEKKRGEEPGEKGL